MNKEFVSYEQALALKELGFDEPCLSYYDGEKLFKFPGTTMCNRNFSDLLTVTAPLYQQCFKWFREKHGLYHHIIPEFYTKGINFNWQILWYLPKEEWTKHVISDGTGLYGDNGEHPTQEEAEQACLDKLIEIIRATK